MPKIVTIRQATAHLSRFLKLAEAGEEIVIARGRIPVARLVPITAQSKKRRVFGALKGKIKFDHSFFDPLPPEELDAWGR